VGVQSPPFECPFPFFSPPPLPTSSVYALFEFYPRALFFSFFQADALRAPSSSASGLSTSSTARAPNPLASVPGLRRSVKFHGRPSSVRSTALSFLAERVELPPGTRSVRLPRDPAGKRLARCDRDSTHLYIFLLRT